MTAEQWLNLKKQKVAVPEVVPEPIIEQTGPENNSVISGSVQPIDEEEDNPFQLGNEETAITAAQDLITTDSEKIKVIGQISSPKAFAFAHMFNNWERLEGAEELAALDEVFIENLEKFECGRKGKENRAKLYAEVLKADLQREFEMQRAGMAEKAFGKR